LAGRVVVGKHALRNALLPIVTILGPSLPEAYARAVSRVKTHRGES
jgi:ABC-type dipeptide/oligopeptide/nickel transport system permease component